MQISPRPNCPQRVAPVQVARELAAVVSLHSCGPPGALIVQGVASSGPCRRGVFGAGLPMQGTREPVCLHRDRATWRSGCRRRRGRGQSNRMPARRRAAMPIELHTWNTPNGRKISVALEEMGLPYNVHPVNIGKGEQFNPDFLKISPNNRIPAIIDPDGPGGAPISVFESGAILIYLGEKTGKFWPQDAARAGAGAGMADVADGRVRPDARPGAPLPAGGERAGPPLRAGALLEGDAPALWRVRQAPGRRSNSSPDRSRSPISPSSAGPGGTSGTRWTWPISPT